MTSHRDSTFCARLLFLSGQAQKLSMLYTVLSADLVQDRDALLRVWRRNIPWYTLDEHAARIHWYLGNPCGPTRMFMARYEPTGEIVGTIGLVSRLISATGITRTAGVVTDIAVDRSHRTAQPALLLTRAIVECLSDKIPLIWTYPNAESVGVFRRAGFRVEGDCISYTKILRSLSRIQRRGIPAPFDRWIAALIDETLLLSSRNGGQKQSSADLVLRAQSCKLASLLARNDLVSTLNVQRSPEFFEWVYERSPYRKYVLLGIGNADEPSLDACACCYIKNGRAELDDIVYRPIPGLLDAVFAIVVQWAMREGCSDLSFRSANLHPTVLCTLQRFGFRPSPWRPLVVLRHSSLTTSFRL